MVPASCCFGSRLLLLGKHISVYTYLDLLTFRIVSRFFNVLLSLLHAEVSVFSFNFWKSVLSEKRKLLWVIPTFSKKSFTPKNGKIKTDNIIPDIVGRPEVYFN